MSAIEQMVGEARSDKSDSSKGSGLGKRGAPQPYDEGSFDDRVEDLVNSGVLSGEEGEEEETAGGTRKKGSAVKKGRVKTTEKSDGRGGINSLECPMLLPSGAMREGVRGISSLPSLKEAAEDLWRSVLGWCIISPSVYIIVITSLYLLFRLP